MLASERRELLLDIQDRLLELYTQRDEAGRDGDWNDMHSIDEEISLIKGHREGIWDRDPVENPEPRRNGD